MKKRYLKVTEKDMMRFGDVWRFRIGAEIGTGNIKFEILCQNHELDEKKIQEINNEFKNSLRYCKHYGGYYDESATKEEVTTAMNKLSSTNMGIGIKIADDPLPEFVPFSL